MRRQLLAELVRPLDRVGSVYLGLGSADVAQRWRALASRLARQGAPDTVVDSLAGLVKRARPAGALVAFASVEKVLWHREVSHWVPDDRAQFGAPPLMTPLLDWLSRHPAHVDVVMDRRGAQIIAVPAGAPEDATSTTVIGPDEEITRGGPRGWDHPRIERRAVSSWWHNAGAVAAATASALKSVDAHLLLVAGERRIEKAMLAQLPKSSAVTVGHLPGGTSSSRESRSAVAQRLVDRFAAQRPTVTAEMRLRTVADVLRALAYGQVRSLLITDRPDDERVAWFGPDVLCTDQPAPGLILGRLVDVAVRAALLTDADVDIVQSRSLGPDGMAAALRFG